MILKCQRVIYSRLMPDLVVAVYKKSPFPAAADKEGGVYYAPMPQGDITL